MKLHWPSVSFNSKSFENRKPSNVHISDKNSLRNDNVGAHELDSTFDERNEAQLPNSNLDQYSKDPKVQKESDPPNSKSEEIFSILSGATQITLAALRDAAQFAPIPYLGQAAGLAITIVDAVQATKGNKGALKSLGEDSCTLVFAVSSTCDEICGGGEEIPPKLEKNMNQLCNTLTDIDHFAQKQRKRGSIKRFLTARSDTDKVLDYRQRLKQALDVFTLQSNITVQQVLSRIDAQQKAMKAQISEHGIPVSQSSIAEGDPRHDGPPTAEHLAPPSVEDQPSQPSAPLPGPSTSTSADTGAAGGAFHGAFPGLFEGNSRINGDVKFTNVAGDQSFVWNNDRSRRNDYGNTYNTNVVGADYVNNMNNRKRADGKGMENGKGMHGREMRNRSGMKNKKYRMGMHDMDNMDMDDIDDMDDMDDFHAHSSDSGSESGDTGSRALVPRMGQERGGPRSGFGLGPGPEREIIVRAGGGGAGMNTGPGRGRGMIPNPRGPSTPRGRRYHGEL